MSKGLHYSDTSNNVCRLIVRINWFNINVPGNTPLESLKRLHNIASELCYNKHIYKNNKFLVNIEPYHITFFIYQNNFLRDFRFKEWYAQDLICLVVGPNGVTTATITDDGYFSVVPYNINQNPNSILTIIAYMATCSTVPVLQFQSNAITIITPPDRPTVTDQVRALDVFNQIRSNGRIHQRPDPTSINSLLGD